MGPYTYYIVFDGDTKIEIMKIKIAALELKYHPVMQQLPSAASCFRALRTTIFFKQILMSDGRWLYLYVLFIKRITVL
jgi:hypothetical protein